MEWLFWKVIWFLIGTAAIIITSVTMILLKARKEVKEDEWEKERELEAAIKEGKSLEYLAKRVNERRLPLGDDQPISAQELKDMTDVDPTLNWLLKNRASEGYKE